MAEILLYIPKSERGAKSNLEDFIEMCRDRLTVFGADLDWQSNIWPKIGNFTVKGAPSRGCTEDQYLAQEILPFAKAYVRYQQGLKPSRLIKEFQALRCIEPALLTVKGRADITLVDVAVMDVAVQFARESYSSAYIAGSGLAKLVDFLNESKIAARRVEWRNPISKPREINRTDIETQKKRSRRLPDELQLEGMGEMFANDLQHPRDRFTTSIFALLMCAPSRISEVQRLPLNALHNDKDSKGINRVGLRFFGGKGAGWDIKYVATSFVKIAEEAVRRLTDLSAEGRSLAKWYEDHPTKFYRHRECPDVDEKAPLSDKQVCSAMGLLYDSTKKGQVQQFFKDYPPYAEQRKANKPLTLEFLNDYCRSVLPASFPYFDVDRKLKYSEALCCYRMHEFRLDLTTSCVKLWVPGKSSFTTDLKYIEGHKQSIWTRHGYKNLDGSAITMTSHQVRHLLNTAAQRGNLGQLDIAKWSARANIRQNATYNHMSEDEYVKLSENALPSGILDKVRRNVPVTFEDLNQTGDGNAHVTIFGFCVHDYSMLPCQKYRDCLNCTEHACIKGDPDRFERLRAQRRLVQDQLDKAMVADTSGYFGADRWSQHQLKTLVRLDQLIELMESPEVCDGSVIMLNNDQEYSPLRRELAARDSARRLPGSAPEVPPTDFVMDAF